MSMLKNYSIVTFTLLCACVQTNFCSLKAQKTIPTMAAIASWKHVGEFAGHIVAYDTNMADLNAQDAYQSTRAINYGYVGQNHATWSTGKGYLVTRCLKSNGTSKTCPIVDENI